MARSYVYLDVSFRLRFRKPPRDISEEFDPDIEPIVREILQSVLEPDEELLEFRCQEASRLLSGEGEDNANLGRNHQDDAGGS